MKILANRIISYSLMGLTAALLSSCKFGFMSLDDKVAPQVEALNFSSDPTLQPSRLIVRTTNAELDYGLCEEVLVQVASALQPPTSLQPNGSSFEVPARVPMTVALSGRNMNISGGPSGGDFYSDKNCLAANKITSFNLQAGYSRKTVYFKPTNHVLTGDALNTFSLTASSINFSSDSATPKVKRVATSLEFYGYTSVFSFGSCNAVSIRAKDVLGNSYNEANKSITLSKSVAAGSFYSDSGCTTVNATAILPGTGNNAFVTVYFKPDQTTLGSSTALTLTGDPVPAGFANFSTTSINVTRVATTLEFYNYSTTFNFGSCNAVSIKGKDALGNPYNEANRSINLSQSVTAGSFYSDSGCTTLNSTVNLPGDGNNAFVTVYFKPDQTTLAGSTAFTLTGDPVPTGFANFSTSSITVLRVANILEFYGYTSTFSFGSCNAVSVRAKDALGNVFNDTDRSITLSQSSTAGSFYSNNVCSSVITNTILPGSGNNASVTVYFKADQISLGSSTALTLTGDPASAGFANFTASITVTRIASVFEFFGYTTTFSFGSCYAVSIRAKDALGNIFNDSARSINLGQSPTAGTFYSNNVCSTSITAVNFSTTGNNASVTVYFKADRTTLSSSTSLTLTGDPVPAGFAGFSTNSITVNRVATSLEFYNYSATFDFGSCNAVSIRGKDALGNSYNEVNRSISLSHVPTAGSFYSNNVCSSVITSTALAGSGNNASITVYFKPDQTTLGGSTSVTLTGDPATTGFANFTAAVTVTRTAETLEFYGYTSPVGFGDCNSISIRARDALGNVYNESAKSISLTQSPTAGSFYSNNGCSSVITTVPLPGTGNNASITVYFKLNQNAMPLASVNLTPTFSGLTSNAVTINISHLVLDSNFGTSGKATLNPGEILSMVKVSSGYLIAGYTVVSSAERAYVALIGNNGSISASFTESTVTGSNSSRINSMIVDGSNIYFAGTADFGGNQGKDWLYGKLILSGTALNSDSNFPIQTKDLGAQDDTVIGIESVDANQLVLVGDKFDVAIAQKSDGTLGTPVIASYSNNASAKCIKKDSSNQILVGGTASNQMAFIKFNPASISLPGSPTLLGNGGVNAITLDASGKILLAGSSGTVMGVRRLNTNLSADATFGTSGLVTYSSATEAKDVTVDSAGQILVSGTSSNQMLIVRYQSNGSFINDGNHLKNIPFTGNSVANRIIFDSTNLNIVLGGLAGTNQAMARLTP